jgi:drug/metabolite transporter (DMT)-like permease
MLDRSHERRSVGYPLGRMEGEKLPAASPSAPYLWAGLAIVLWATLAAVVGDALDHVPASTVVLLAFAFATPTLLLIDLARGRTLRAIFGARPAVIALGLWGLFGYHALFFEALARAPIVEANLLNYLWPLFMVLFAPLLAKEKITGLMLVGAVVGFAGAALVVTQTKGNSPERPSPALGYAFAALAAVAWSSFSVLLRRLGKEGEDRMTLFSACSLAATIPWALASGTLELPPTRVLVAGAWLGIGPMGIAFWCWNRALSTGSAAKIGLLSYLDPLLSTLAVAIVLKKELTTSSWLGMALIVLGAAGPPVIARFR